MPYPSSTRIAQKYLNADAYLEQQLDGNKHLSSLIEAAKHVTDDRLERKLIITMLRSDDLLGDYGFCSWASDQVFNQRRHGGRRIG